jgi:hypothetical protein
LAAVSLIATGAELAIARHWGSPYQYIPWAATGVALLAIGILVVVPTRPTVIVARALALLLIVVSAVGTYQHIESNYSAGASPGGYGEEWAAMSEMERWWGAASGGIQGAAPLAPLIFGFTGTLLLAATVRHPALARAPGIEERSPIRSARDRSIARGA